MCEATGGLGGGGGGGGEGGGVLAVEKEGRMIMGGQVYRKTLKIYLEICFLVFSLNC